MVLSVALFACLLANLPGPPGFVYQNEAYFQAYPVWRSNKLCPNISPKKDVSFFLYTRANNGRKEDLVLGNDRLLRGSTFDPRRPTVIYIHGFLEGAVALSSDLIKSSYMTRGDHNVILVDYRRLAAGPWYVTAVSNSLVVGRYVARFIDYLASRGMRLASLHVVGLSLGAHVAGSAGRNVKSGRLPRITGLDPAGPLFDLLPPNVRLDQSCATFVDVIHTDITAFGTRNPAGHADFYPNGGYGAQPGCKISAINNRQGTFIEKLFCSHWRAFQYFAESVVNTTAFPAQPCSGRKLADCSDRDDTLVYMGLATPNTARGYYFLRTREKSPYSVLADNEITTYL